MEALNLREVIVFLSAAGLVVPLMQRLKISPVLGFLVVGLAIGPFGFGRLVDQAPWIRFLVIEDQAGVRALAELGVVFLLFMIGLELSFQRLLAMGRLVFGLGGAQVVVTGIAIAATALAFANPPATAVVLGACLALSSTAIVMQLLIESRRLGSATGHASFGVLLFQDLAVVPILFFVAVLGANAEGNVGLSLLLALGKAILAITVIVLLGRTIVRPLFGLVGATRSRELFMAAVLLVVIATAIATEAAGLSPALGAFLAGLLLAECEYQHQIDVDVEPFKGLLLGLFFVSVGMSIDIAAIAHEPLWIPASVIGLLILKSAILYALALLFGLARPVAAETALLLAQGGEFAFIVVAAAQKSQLLPTATGQFVLVVTSLTMLATPVIAVLARRLGREMAKREPVRTGDMVPDLSGEVGQHVIVAGYGRVGQLLGSLLGEHRIPHVGLDVDPAVTARFRKIGAAVFYGDASRADILRRAGIDNAIALAVTMDSVRAAEQVVTAVRRDWPTLPILVRARDAEHARRLYAAGATDVVPETVEASLELAEVLLRAAGFSDEAARQVVSERRDVEKARPAPPKQ